MILPFKSNILMGLIQLYFKLISLDIYELLDTFYVF